MNSLNTLYFSRNKFQNSNTRGYLDANFSSLNFCHSSLITHYSSLITHHLKYPTRLAPSLNIFHTVYGLHTCHSVQLFFSQYPNSPNLIKKKRKKETQKPEPSERRRKKKQELKTEPRKRKGKKMVNRCGCGSLHVCLITEVSLNYD